MKKILCILFIFVLVLILVSCKKKDKKGDIGTIDGPGSASIDYNDLVGDK